MKVALSFKSGTCAVKQRGLRKGASAIPVADGLGSLMFILLVAGGVLAWQSVRYVRQARAAHAAGRCLLVRRALSMAKWQADLFGTGWKPEANHMPPCPNGGYYNPHEPGYAMLCSRPEDNLPFPSELPFERPSVKAFERKFLLPATQGSGK